MGGRKYIIMLHHLKISTNEQANSRPGKDDQRLMRALMRVDLGTSDGWQGM